MRTSASQFEIMVSFMEQHGDLSKPIPHARGRITALRLWEQLTELLNSDGSGDTKTTERWKKVWSDFKNNVKKKSARIHRSMGRTGGGPAIMARLNDIEQRVLQLVGFKIATGMAIQEAGLSQENPLQHSQSLDEPGPSSHDRNDSIADSSQVPVVIEVLPEDTDSPQIFDQITTAQLRPVRSSPIIREEEVEGGMVTPTQPISPPLSQVHVRARPSPNGHTPRGRRNTRRGSPGRLSRPTQVEQMSRVFLQCDADWRSLINTQHQENMDMRREKYRIREMELQVQKDWQALGIRALGLIEKIVNKYCSI